MSSEKAELAFRKGDLDAATAFCDQALSESANDAIALRIMGMIEVQRGRPDEAIRFFRQALDVAPKDFLALEWLQGALMQTGRFQQGVEVGEQALALRPNDVNILVGLSQSCLKSGDPPRAIRTLEQARSLSPQNAVIRHLLGLACEKGKRNRDALNHYREAIRLQPTLKDAYDRALRLLLEDGRFAAVLKLCEQAFAALPNYGQARLSAAQALAALGKRELADAMVTRAVELDPDLAAPASNWLQAYGRSSEAEEILERSIRERPVQGRAYYGLIRGRKMGAEDRDLLAKMERLLETSELPLRERLTLVRALGKAADDRGEYELAMQRFDEAAQLAEQAYIAEGAFDPRRLGAARKSLLALVDPRFMERYRHLGRRGESPIFVIGMIRSGTTLVQQILGSHPDVGDAGEQPFWTTVYPSVIDLDAGEIREPQFIEARDHYLEVVRRFAPSSARVSNKWPMNYAFAPLLLLAYPEAKIIHVSRNPVDTALSIYMSDLGEPPPEFSYNKGNIVAVYRDYQERMRHWETVIPSSSMFRIRYEDLVADQEDWTRQMISFCGLSWDDRCLEFYTGDRLVNTPSMLQVRRPIYTTSTEKWRRYEPWLGDLRSLL